MACFEKKICCKIVDRDIIYVFTNFQTVLSICDFTVVMSFNVFKIERKCKSQRQSDKKRDPTSNIYMEMQFTK